MVTNKLYVIKRLAVILAKSYITRRMSHTVQHKRFVTQALYYEIPTYFYYRYKSVTENTRHNGVELPLSLSFSPAIMVF